MPYRVFANYLKVKKGLFMKKLKLTRTIAAAICAAIAVLGCVFFKPQTDINQAAADVIADNYYIDDFSLNFSSDGNLKCRLKVYIDRNRLTALTSFTHDSALGENVYPTSLHILIATSDSDIHGEDLKKMVAPTPSVDSTGAFLGLIFADEYTSSFINSNVKKFAEVHSIILKTYNKGDGSTTFNYSADSYGNTFINFDFSLPYLSTVLKYPEMRSLFDSDFTFYCVISGTQTYKIGNASYSDCFYREDTKNVLVRNIADEARKMLKDNSTTYTAEQQSVLKTVAGQTNEESSSLNKNTDDSFKSLKKAIMAVCGVAIIAGVCVCVYLIFKRKGFSFYPVKRKTNSGKVRQRKK